MTKHTRTGTPYASSPYINWLGAQLANPNTPELSYKELRAEWDRLVSTLNMPNVRAMRKNVPHHSFNAGSLAGTLHDTLSTNR